MTEVLITKIIVGIICGIWPLVVGFRTKQHLLGIAGFLLALGGGLITGFLLAAPLAYGCGWFIERRNQREQTQAAGPPDSNTGNSRITD